MPPGGKLERNETPENGIVREVNEEIHVSCSTEDIERVGLLYVVKHTPHTRFRSIVHLYLIRHWIGTPTGSAKIKDPGWFPQNLLPNDRMLAGHILFIPRIFAGKNVVVQAAYNIADGGMRLTNFFMQEMNRPPWSRQ
jgi:8-oxo-dGTP pyrophosphatase MutT (NUDIX family)